jgi:rod shape-determining protein MreC
VENQNAALSARIEELEREIQTLTATRAWDADGRRLGSSGRLIPAHVLGEDVLPWRSSRLLSAGTWQSVREGQAVINRGQDAQVRSGLAILLGQVLVGVVEQPASHCSRVKLISDPSTQMKVRLGRFKDGRFALIDGYFWLTGRGRGRMEIRDVDKREGDTGTIAVGDVVLSDPRNELLPAALTIGRVVEITLDRDNPLFAILAIQSMVPEASLDRVYIYDPRPESPSTSQAP